MNITITPSYETLSNVVADEIIKQLSTCENPLFCPASGDTPAGLYHELAQRQQQGAIDTSNWNFVGLDEWSNMNGADEGSCRYWLDKQLFNPLQVNKERICFFDGRATEPQKECELVENFIQIHNGIDVVVLGLGMNGHVGMNEPGIDPQLYSHVAKLDSVTSAVGQKYFSTQQQLTHGLTLGIASIMQAKHIILMVSGEKKSQILQQVVEGEITSKVPASLLRAHPGFSLFADEAASKHLSHSSNRKKQ